VHEEHIKQVGHSTPPQTCLFGGSAFIISATIDDLFAGEVWEFLSPQAATVSTNEPLFVAMWLANGTTLMQHLP
jgi:hypothetical protein